MIYAKIYEGSPTILVQTTLFIMQMASNSNKSYNLDSNAT